MKKEEKNTQEIPVYEMLPISQATWDEMSEEEKVFIENYYYKVYKYITYTGKIKNNPVLTITSYCSYEKVYIKVNLLDGENNIKNNVYRELQRNIDGRVTQNLPNWDTILIEGTYIFAAKISSLKCYGLYAILKNEKKNEIYQEILKFVLKACNITNINYGKEPYDCTWVTIEGLKKYYKQKREIQEAKQAKAKAKQEYANKVKKGKEYYEQEEANKVKKGKAYNKRKKEIKEIQSAIPKHVNDADDDTEYPT